MLTHSLCNFQHDFTSSDFESMPASLAYAMFKNKSEFPLHTAVRTKREDVVFLYLVENDAQVSTLLKYDVNLDSAYKHTKEGHVY